MRWATLLIVGIGAFHLLTIRPGHSWGDDFAQYISHARNIATGAPYAETGYLYNPHEPKLGPKIYPPGFPALLAPAWAAFGLNLRAMKAEIVLCFMAFLAFVALTVRRRVPLPHLLALVAVIGLNPYLWDFKDHVLSDIPFAAAVFLCAWCAGVVDGRRVWQGVLLGALVYCAYSIRTVGVVLIPSLALQDLVRNRRLSAFTLAAVATASALVALQAALLPGVGSYRDQFDFSPGWILHNLGEYARALPSFWDRGTLTGVAATLTVLGGMLCLLGYARAVRRNPGLLELFVPLYCLALLPADNEGLRFLIPLAPLFVLYGVEGLVGVRAIFGRAPAWTERAALGLLLVLLVGCYLTAYGRTDFGPMRNSVTDADAQEMFRFVREKTEPDAVVVFNKPRALALYTGRASSCIYYADEFDDALAYLEEIDARYLAMRRDTRYLRRLTEERRERFDLLFSNAGFAVFRVRNP